MQNSLEPRSKMSSLEGLLNQAFFFVVVFLIAMLIICTICYRTWFVCVFNLLFFHYFFVMFEYLFQG